MKSQDCYNAQGRYIIATKNARSRGRFDETINYYALTARKRLANTITKIKIPDRAINPGIPTSSAKPVSGRPVGVAVGVTVNND
jgi:hypothetical protein